LASKQAHNLSTYKLLSTKTSSKRSKNISSERNQSIEKERPVRIIELLQENASKDGLSGSDLAKHFGITRQAIHRDIKKLCEFGKVKISGKGRYSKIKLTPSE
jgi:biotin operon repressor